MKVSIIAVVLHESGNLGSFVHIFDNAKDLRNAWAKMKKEHSKEGYDYEYYLVNRSKATPRPDDLFEEATYCPYCADARKFVKNESLDVTQCQVCEVSSHEYHVRKQNRRSKL